MEQLIPSGSRWGGWKCFITVFPLGQRRLTTARCTLTRSSHTCSSRTSRPGRRWWWLHPPLPRWLSASGSSLDRQGPTHKSYAGVHSHGSTVHHKTGGKEISVCCTFLSSYFESTSLLACRKGLLVRWITQKLPNQFAPNLAGRGRGRKPLNIGADSDHFKVFFLLLTLAEVRTLLSDFSSFT